MIQHVPGILFSPERSWQGLAAGANRAVQLLPFLVLAVIPAVAWYHGTTTAGWTVGGGEAIRLTPASALRITLLFYAGMCVSTFAIGYCIHWMAESYGARSTAMRGLVIAAWAATPMLLAGAVGFYPHLMIDMLIGMIATSWSIYLLYRGIPIVMGIPQERGFLFASAVVAVALVMLIVLMGASVILWDLGAAPEFTD